jgi:transcriptional regulator with XRE-family HTH domain
MTGEELRAKRMELGLYQGNLAGQLQSLGLELPGGQKIDQPAISQMERGRIPIPAEVAAAMAQVQPGNDSPPPVGQPRERAGAEGGQQRGGGRRQRVRRKPQQPEPEPAAQGEPGGAGGGVAPPTPPPPPAPEPEREPAPEPERPGDRPPAPAPTVGRVSWDAAAKSQLEADLRDLFAGQHFLVPMRIQREDGSHEIVHQDAFLPGVAQLAGAVGGAPDEDLIRLHAASMAHAWAELADENPGVRRFLMGMTYGGAWRGVIAATLPVVLGLAGNHGIGLPGFLGGAAPSGAVSLEP